MGQFEMVIRYGVMVRWPGEARSFWIARNALDTTRKFYAASWPTVQDAQAEADRLASIRAGRFEVRSLSERDLEWKHKY